MAIARVFRTGNSQAVRLPRGFHLNRPTVEIFRRGDEIVLRERVAKSGNLAEVLEILASMLEDAFEGIKDKRPLHTRKRLSRPRSPARTSR